MATVPFEFECDKESGFVMDPNANKRFGYVTSLDGFGLATPLASDLQVHIPFNTGIDPIYKGLKYTKPAPGKPVGVAKVVGVIEKFSWEGGVGSPIKIEFFVSQENATQVKALQQLALKHTKIQSLAWWIANYDQEAKLWYEQAYPLTDKGDITGIITGKDNPELDVNLEPVVVKDGIDVNVYKVTIGVVPAANLQYTLHFANTEKMKVIKSWGLVVGTMAAQAMTK